MKVIYPNKHHRGAARALWEDISAVATTATPETAEKFIESIALGYAVIATQAWQDGVTFMSKALAGCIEAEEENAVLENPCLKEDN